MAFPREIYTPDQINLRRQADAAHRITLIDDALTAIRTGERVEHDNDSRWYKAGQEFAAATPVPVDEMRQAVRERLHPSTFSDFMRGVADGSKENVDRCECGWSPDDTITLDAIIRNA